MRDGPLRTLVKLVALARFSLDLRITRLIRRLRERPDYRLGGSCKGCGGCCETPLIQVHPLLFHIPTVRRAMLGWHRMVNRLDFVEWDRESSSMVFCCLHFDRQTRRCDSYATRPGMCRDYPRALLDSPNPPFIAGCGYYAVSRQAAKMRAALADVDLNGDERERLERRLHARE